MKARLPSPHSLASLSVENVENNWPTFQDGIGKAAFSPFCRAHVLKVRSARQKGCGLAGRTFLTIPLAAGVNRTLDIRGYSSTIIQQTQTWKESPLA